MAVSTNVDVILTARDNASGVINNFANTASDAGNKVNRNFLDFLSPAVSGLKEIGTVGWLGVAALTAFGGVAAVAGAKAEMLEKTFEVVAKNAGLSQKAIYEMKDALAEVNTTGTMADKIMTTFVRSGLSAQVNFKDFILMTKDFAASVGVTSGQAIEDFTESLLTLNPSLLKTYGISLNLNQVYKTYADTLGKTALELTGTEKRQALLNEILKQGIGVAGVYKETYDTAGKNLLSIQGYMIGMTETIGKILNPAFGIVTQLILDLLVNATKFFRDNSKEIELWGLKIALATAEGLKFAYDVILWLIDHKEVVIGMLVAVGIGMAIVAGAFLLAHAPAILVFAAVTAIVTAGQLLIEKLGGIDNIIKVLQPTLDVFYLMWNDFIFPALTRLWTTINTQLIPALQGIWNTISPVLIPILKFLALVLMGVVFLAILGVIEIVTQVIKWFADWVKSTDKSIQAIIKFFTDLPGNISSALSSLAGIIRKPFDDAWNAISPILNKIKEGLNKISPFHKSSPSLVENVTAGVDLIKKQYESLTDIKLPSLSGFQTNGLMPNPIGSPQYAMSNNQEEMQAFSKGSNSGGQGVTFNINIGMYAGSETEKRNIAKSLYASLLQVAQSQNKTIQELYG